MSDDMFQHEDIKMCGNAHQKGHADSSIGCQLQLDSLQLFLGFEHTLALCSLICSSRRRDLVVDAYDLTMASHAAFSLAFQTTADRIDSENESTYESCSSHSSYLGLGLQGMPSEI